MKWTDQELHELALFLSRRMTVRTEPGDPTGAEETPRSMHLPQKALARMRRLLEGDEAPVDVSFGAGGVRLSRPGQTYWFELIDPDKADTAQTSGDDPVEAWTNELFAARESGRLPALARKISRISPADENLQQACVLLSQPATPMGTRRLRAAAAATALLTLVGGTSWALSGGTPPAPPALQPQSVDVQTLAMTTPPAPAVQSVTPRVPVAPPTSLPPQPEPEPVLPVATPIAPAPGCDTDDGALVGYWYAGEDRPGVEGETIVMLQTVNVRADYPDVHNNFEKRAPIQCVLKRGATLTLSRAPLLVPGNRYWVPLVSGDLHAG